MKARVYRVAVTFGIAEAVKVREAEMVFRAGTPLLVLAWDKDPDGEECPCVVEKLCPSRLQRVPGKAPHYIYTGTVSGLGDILDHAAAVREGGVS